MRTQSGFTVVELLVVLAILAVLFGIGAGVFLGLADTQRREAAQQEVINLVRKARNAARGEERSAVLLESDEGLTVVRAVILVDRQEGGLENIRQHVEQVSAIITRDELLSCHGLSSGGKVDRGSETF